MTCHHYFFIFDYNPFIMAHFLLQSFSKCCSVGLPAVGGKWGDFDVCKPMVKCQGTALGLVEAFEAPQQIKWVSTHIITLMPTRFATAPAPQQ